MDELQSLIALGTVAGAAAMTLIIVQLFKPLLPWLNTRLFVIITALILTQIPAFFVAGGTVEMHLIALFNAILAATSAMGTYVVTLKPGDDAKKLAAGGGG